MPALPQLFQEAYVTALRQQMEDTLRRVADAINTAPDGAVITGSDRQVRDLFDQLRQQAYEHGVQMRLTAADAAFSPGASDDRPAAAE